MIALESQGDLLVLLRSNRARRVDDATAWPGQRQHRVENFALETGQVGDRMLRPTAFARRGQSPLLQIADAEARVGTAAEDAEPGAGRVDENDVGTQVPRWTLRDLDPRSRSPRALAEPPQPIAIGIACHEAAFLPEI